MSSIPHSAFRIPHSPGRGEWTKLEDDVLLRQCSVDTYRASGPGGQKRNKTSSAVRLRHEPSGLIVIAEESRSQHENKAKALRRLKKALFLELREALAPEALTPAAIATIPDYAPALDEGRLRLRVKDPRFWPALGVVLDVLVAVEAKVSAAAELLGITTGNLIAFLETDAKAWQQANNLRAQFGLKGLKTSS